MRRSCCLLFVSLAILIFSAGTASAEESRLFFQGGAMGGRIDLKTERKTFGTTILDETNRSGSTPGSIFAAGSINNKRLIAMELSTLRFENSSFFNVMAVYDYFLFQNSRFKPYIGGHLGLSTMNWKKDVDPIFKTKGHGAKSIGIGARAGIMYSLSKKYIIDAGYQYTHINLDTKFTVGAAELILTAENYNGFHINLICPF